MIDYDKPGYCAKCHCLVARLHGNRILSMLGKHRIVRFVLDDGSKMDVSLCSKCVRNLKPGHTEQIMHSVFKGWEKECDKLVLDQAVNVNGDIWTEEFKNNHLEKYAQRSIVNRDDKRWSDNAIKDALKEIKEAKQ